MRLGRGWLRALCPDVSIGPLTPVARKWVFAPSGAVRTPSKVGIRPVGGASIGRPQLRPTGLFFRPLQEKPTARAPTAHSAQSTCTHRGCGAVFGRMRAGLSRTTSGPIHTERSVGDCSAALRDDRRTMSTAVASSPPTSSRVRRMEKNCCPAPDSKLIVPRSNSRPALTPSRGRRSTWKPTSTGACLTPIVRQSWSSRNSSRETQSEEPMAPARVSSLITRSNVSSRRNQRRAPPRPPSRHRTRTAQ